MRRSRTRVRAKAAGYRSGFEQRVASQAKKDGLQFEYEPSDAKIAWQPKPSKYLPDIVLSNGIIVEIKGRFTRSDRAKHRMIKEQHPELDIRFVFQRDNAIYRGSKTRYSTWCDQRGFRYAFNSIPSSWGRE